MIWLLLILGLCLGSFINALVYRIYNNKNKKQKLSILKGRSICPQCKHLLNFIDLIPVINWILLKGKCRYCNKPISIQYPLVELSTAILFAISYIFWPLSFDSFGKISFIYWLIYLVFFMALIIYDLKWMILPDKLVFSLTFIACSQLLVNILISEKDGISLVTNVAMSILIASGLFWLLFQLSKGRWIGGGDVKLGLAIGIILADPYFSLAMLFIASLLGIIYALPGMITKKLNKNKQIPFGPFLIVATIIIYLFGSSLINWYKSQFLLM